MANATVGFLLENIKQLLLYNAQLIGDAKNEVQRLHGDLNLFKAFIRDYTERRVTTPMLDALVDNIRIAVYKAEDAIDEFVVEKTTHKEKNAFGKFINSIDHSLKIREVATTIESLKNNVSQIYNQKQFTSQDLRPVDSGASERQPPAVEEENVVGFDEDAETVIARLTGEDQDLNIITIIGMAGLGKTTLAKKIYEYLKTLDQSKDDTKFAWAYISEKYDKARVLLSIFRDFGDKTHNYQDRSNDNIAGELLKYLRDKKYLIVLDDVWTKETWNDFRKAFPNNNKGSRILITSQRKEVASHASPTKEPHNMKFLTPEKSWELLETTIFGQEKCPGELQKFGEQIATDCRGLPIAIVAIAHILKEKRVPHFWEDVSRDVNSFLETDKLFMDVLALSYHNLRYDLKSCFLYLGFFPEGYAIPVWKLIRLWIAEGFIEQKGTRSLEEIAETCVEDLANMNLLLVARKGSDGRIKTCRVHDMLHNFCRKQAGKQNFYQETKSSNEVALNEYRRVCIHSDAMEYISTRPSGKLVRAFLSFDPDDITLPREHVSTIPKAFKLLRVLDIICISFDIFPKELLQLVLLRYIAISCNIKALPSSISKLWNMQTLIFMTTSPTLELTKGMWKMYQLRHLRTNASALLPSPPPNPLKIWTNVQSLTTISPESCTENVFEMTPNIKKLGIRGNLVGVIDKLFDNVAKLEDLTNLKLFNHVLSLTTSEARIVHLPLAYKFPTKLKKLTLSRTLLQWEHMRILGKLDKLEVLKLKDNAFKGKVWEPEDGGFLALKHLHIGKTNLVIWKASKHHFPSLKRLVLQYREKLEAVPSALADVASFQTLELYYTNERAAASARVIQRKTMPKEGQDTKSGGGLNLYIYPPDI